MLIRFPRCSTLLFCIVARQLLIHNALIDSVEVVSYAAYVCQFSEVYGKIVAYSLLALDALPDGVDDGGNEMGLAYVVFGDGFKDETVVFGGA